MRERNKHLRVPVCVCVEGSEKVKTAGQLGRKVGLRDGRDLVGHSLKLGKGSICKNVFRSLHHYW